MRFPTDLRVQNRQIAGQKYSNLPNAKAKIDRRHAFNTIKSTGQKIWFPARRCRCPDLRPAGPLGVPPHRFAALDPGRRRACAVPALVYCPRSSDVLRWRPCYLWPPRRMPHGPVRRFWPRGPLWAARPDDPVARVRLRPGGRPACGARKSQTAGRGGRRCVSRRGRADPSRHAPRSPATTLWPHAASSGAACSP